MAPPLVAARLFACLALAWFLFSAILLRDLILLTRYYMVVGYLLLLIVAIWARFALWPARKRLTIAIAMVFVLVNLMSITLDEKNPRWGERMLVVYLAESTGPVHVDPETARRAHFFCRWSGEDCSRIVAAPPESGQLGSYFFYAQNAGLGFNKAIKTDTEAARYQPQPGWQTVWSRQESPKPLAGLMQSLGMEERLPPGIYRKLAGPARQVLAYEIP